MAANPEEDYNLLQGLAERLGLDDKQREGFISESMQRFGYKPKTSWEPGDDPEDGNDSGGFFGGSNSSGKRGGRSNSGGRGNSGGGGGWQYDS